MDYQVKFGDCERDLQICPEAIDTQVALEAQKIQQNATECHSMRDQLITNNTKLEEAAKAH